MTERALAILRDGALHGRLGASAAARARDFSTERIVPHYETLYRGVLGD